MRMQWLDIRPFHNDPMFYKIQHHLIAIPLPSFILRPYRLKPEYPHRYQIVFASTESYKNSFFIRTVHQWNLLPPSTATLNTLNCFKEALSSYIPQTSVSLYASFHKDSYFMCTFQKDCSVSSCNMHYVLLFCSRTNIPRLCVILFLNEQSNKQKQKNDVHIL